jgi:hypothetical protein
VSGFRWEPQPCPVIITGPEEAPDVEALEARLRDAEREMAARLNEAIFATPVWWPPAKPVPVPWRTRLGWRWYAVREWVAAKVLRVDVGRDGEDE